MSIAVSNSEMRAFQWCQRHWYLAYYRGFALAPRHDRPVGDAKLGTRIHLALELWYGHGYEPRQVISVIYDRARAEHARDLDNVRRLDKEHDLALAMVDGYVDWVAETGIDEGLEVIGVEEEIVVPSAVTGVDFRAKLDQRVTRTHDGARLFLDHKPQPLSEPVLTPRGWRQMGAIAPGDEVISADGSPTKVINVYDRGVDDVYRVTFNDGTSVRATADHPWMIKTYLNGVHHLTETRALRVGHRTQPFTPIHGGQDVDLGVDPYVLGFWLGNGDRRLRGVCDGEENTITECERRAALKRVTVDGRGRGVWNGSFNRQTINAMRALGCEGLYSSERSFVDRLPDGYLTSASHAQRLDLLRGLMDSDGFMTVSSSVKYGTTSSQLAEDVAELVRSLGGWARIWRCDRPNWVGTKETGYPTKTFGYLVTIRLTDNPFLASKYHDRLQQRRESVAGHRGTNSTDKIVKKIEPAGRELVRCLEIETPDHLYVTAGWTVTHNTVASFEHSTVLLHLDPQMRFYAMLDLLQAKTSGGDAPRTDGGLWNMLRRTKRTAAAKPPFYKREEVRFNLDELRSTWLKANVIASQIAVARQALDAGGDHRSHVPSNPSRDCVWRCPFVRVCPLLDDGSAWEAAMAALYVIHDPYSYYQGDAPAVIAQLRATAGGV